MIPIDRWNEHAARVLKDPLLTPHRLQELHANELLLVAREEREVYGIVCLLPLGNDLAVVHGLCICDADPDEQRSVGVPLVENILTRAEKLGRTALIPPVVMPYVQRVVLTRKETGMDLTGLQGLMDTARVPRNHALRGTTFKIAGRKSHMTASAPRTTTHTEL